MASVKMNGSKGNKEPRILLVVSNDLIRDVLKELFERSGYNTAAVDTAKDGFKEMWESGVCQQKDEKGLCFFTDLMSGPWNP